MYRISSKTHGLLDYLVGGAIAALPHVVKCNDSFQEQQDFPICPNLDDPDACNVYKNLNFPPEVYEAINAYYQQKAQAT